MLETFGVKWCTQYFDFGIILLLIRNIKEKLISQWKFFHCGNVWMINILNEKIGEISSQIFFSMIVRNVRLFIRTA